MTLKLNLGFRDSCMRCDEASTEPKLITRKTFENVKADVIDLHDHPMCLWLLMLSNYGR